MESKFWQTIERLAAVLVIVAVLAGGVRVGIQQFSDPEVAQGDGYATACYRAVGGDTWVCGSGGEMEFQSGATLDLQAGSSLVSAGSVALADLTVDGAGVISDSLTVSGTTALVGATTATAIITANGGLAGDVTGDLTGDVTGNVSGATSVTATTLYGDLVGDVTGDLTGNVSGATSVTATTLYGDLVGDVTGDLTGDVTGPTTLTGLLTVTDEIQFGTNALYPLGVGLAGFQIGFGSVTMTGTVTATHATGTPYTVLCTLDTWSIDTAFCVALGTTGIITATVYDLTGTEAVAPVKINWLVIGMP